MTGQNSITLQQLRHFVAVAATGQVSRAAKRCRISQPSITVSLKNLEAGVGRPLLVRHSEGLRLTAEGECFLRYAENMLDVLAKGLRDVQTPSSSIAGEISIAVTETITGYLLPELIEATQRRFPDVNLKVAERERVIIERDLTKNQIDCAIVLTSNLTKDHSFACETLLRSNRQLWARPDHPLLTRDRLQLSDVAAFDYVLLDMDEHIGVVEDYWTRFGLVPRTIFRSKSIEGVRSLVAQGLGVTILSDLVFRGWSHDAGRLTRKPLTDSVPSMDVGLATNPNAPLGPTQAIVIEFMKSIIKQLGRHC